MTEWQVVGVIVTLISLVGVILGPVVKLNGSIVRLTEAVDDFEKTARRLEDADDKMRNENKRAHKQFYDRLDGAEKLLSVHDVRITRLEEAAGS